MIADTNTSAGAWSIYYNDIALMSTDGTVHPIYARQKTVSLTVSGTSGVTGVSYSVNHDPGVLGASNFSDNMTNYYHGDHLGSQRLMTSVDGYPVWSATYLPFGQEWNPQPTINHYKFTGKERDSESSLDYFGARYDSSSLGRFMSPDIGPVHLGNPQSLNRYAYALNNPLFFVDPDGEDSISAVYRLGTASVNTFVESGQSVDTAAVLASFAGPSLVPLGQLQQDQSNVSGGSGDFSRYIPFPNAGGGGCVLGCTTMFNEVPVGISISLSFSYDDKTGKITGANIELLANTGASFIGPDPRPQRSAFQALPGLSPSAELFSVNIDPNVLRQLSSEQLQALLTAATTGLTSRNPIYRAIARAVVDEERRRAEEQRKKEEEERKKKCQQSGAKECP